MSQFTVTVELRPHIGVMVKEGARIEVEHPQWIVLASLSGHEPRQVGYIGHKSGDFMPLSHVRVRYGKQLYEDIAREATDARDKAMSALSE